ncbi:HAD family phosphatase [Vibrio splendidus]|uniref:Cof-type HAD-IIB family hydrolase n=1 Tax=Vibrio splendidus TaxID=29497 RepID=UPI00148D6ABD|nr:Cof-type HAD-IIB family hydrolase [Vibrio splendidus]NOI91829.1 HAD family phosphatase [Vibrio splendidus]
MYKLIALDMDGTLLNSEKVISQENKDAIAKARAAGVKVVLASGRPLEGMQSKLDELSINGEDDFVLFYNGSKVQNVSTKEIIHSEISNGRSAKQIAALAQELGGYVHAFSKIHGLITPENNEYTAIEARINGLEITEFDFSQLEDDHEIIKTMIVAEPSKLTEIIGKLPQELKAQFTIVQSAPFFLEFLNPNSNKGVGIKAIAKHLGIKAEEVICMGDAENDHHMLEYAGMGIAMENAMEETKKLADYITASNDDHGVAVAIEKFIFNS